MKTKKLDEYEVTATLQLHAFKVQPFLVGKTEKFAHPQLCKLVFSLKVFLFAYNIIYYELIQ